MELGPVVLRALFAYLVLHQLFRHGGKRTVASAAGASNRSGIDLMVALLVGDLIDDLLWAEVPAAQFVVAAGTLVVLHVMLSLGRSRSSLVWRVVEGVPRQVLAGGRPLAAGLRAERLNLKALASLLRSKGIDSGRWTEVRAAWVENTGPVSVLPEPWARRATRQDAHRLPDASA